VGTDATPNATTRSSRLRRALPSVRRHFADVESNVFTEAALRATFESQRGAWGLTMRDTATGFIAKLVEEAEMRLVQLRFPLSYPSVRRYCWGEVPLLDLVQTFRKDSYFSHYTALQLHGLTEQVPKSIYLNHEQRPQPRPELPPTQERVDRAFRVRQRVTRCTAELDGFTIHIVNGKHTGQLAVSEVTLPEGEGTVRTTDLDRALIDAAVRPDYCGGVHEVLHAYQAAADRASPNRIRALLQQLDYAYPYHQAIGFYLERSGAFDDAAVALFRELPQPIDFYLAHDMRETQYVKQWRLHVPRDM